MNWDTGRYATREATMLDMPAAWLEAEIAGYWGRMDGLDARTVFARDSRDRTGRKTSCLCSHRR